METTWNDNGCCLNIDIGPKVVVTTFKFTGQCVITNTVINDVDGWDKYSQYIFVLARMQSCRALFLTF